MKKCWILLIGLLSFAGIAPMSAAGTIHPELLSRLNTLPPEEDVSVIVTLTDQLDLKQFKGMNKKARRAGMNKALRAKAEKTQKPLKEFLKQKKGRQIRSFWIFNGMAVTLPANQVDALANRPEVESVRLDAVHTLPPQVPAQVGTPEWNLNAIKAPDFWELGFTGQGVVIASMDTGVDYLHPDIGPKWRGGTNSWLDFDPVDPLATPYDQAGSNSGHGTAVMGLLVGGDAGGSSIGVAPEAQWIAVKIFWEAGNPPDIETTDSAIHTGFQWLLDPDDNPVTDDLPDVINASWGFDTQINNCYTEFQADVQALKAAGVAVVFSAGNVGPGSATSISPANYPESFAAGSVDEWMTVADHSSRGPSACDASIFPEIVAPGVNVRTTDLTLGGTFPHSYSFMSGTSFAAPHASGAMALLLSAKPDLTVAELEAALTGSAVDLGDPGPDNDAGYGLLDVLAAAQSLFDIYPLTVTVRGRGRITSDPAGIDCPGDCTKKSIDQDVVTLTAVTDPNSTFVGWTGDCTGQDLTCAVTMDQARNVTADFYSFPWELFIPLFITGRDH